MRSETKLSRQQTYLEGIDFSKRILNNLNCAKKIIFNKCFSFFKGHIQELMQSYLDNKIFKLFRSFLQKKSKEYELSSKTII